MTPKLFDIGISGKARKTSKKLPERYKRRVIEFLLVVHESPVPTKSYDLLKLEGYKDTFRVRIGDVRVIYEVLWSERTINVLVIKSREKAYS